MESNSLDVQYNHAMSEKSTSEVGFSRRQSPPIRKIVENQIAELKLQIQEREELLEALKNNPGTEAVLDKLRKLHL